MHQTIVAIGALAAQQNKESSTVLCATSLIAVVLSVGVGGRLCFVLPCPLSTKGWDVPDFRMYYCVAEK